MIESFKQFRKRHLSNDPVIALFPLGSCRKASAVQDMAHHSLMKKVGENHTKQDDGETKNGNKDGLLHVGGPASGFEDACVSIGCPMEPNEIDHPIRCPHPEHGVIQDGRSLKERLPSIKRQGQLLFLTECEVQELQWKRRTAPSDCQIFPAASAPEASFLTFLP